MKQIALSLLCLNICVEYAATSSDLVFFETTFKQWFASRSSDNYEQLMHAYEVLRLDTLRPRWAQMAQDQARYYGIDIEQMYQAFIALPTCPAPAPIPTPTPAPLPPVEPPQPVAPIVPPVVPNPPPDPVIPVVPTPIIPTPEPQPQPVPPVIPPAPPIEPPITPTPTPTPTPLPPIEPPQPGPIPPTPVPVPGPIIPPVIPPSPPTPEPTPEPQPQPVPPVIPPVPPVEPPINPIPEPLPMPGPVTPTPQTPGTETTNSSDSDEDEFCLATFIASLIPEIKAYVQKKDPRKIPESFVKLSRTTRMVRYNFAHAKSLTTSGQPYPFICRNTSYIFCQNRMDRVRFSLLRLQIAQKYLKQRSRQQR